MATSATDSIWNLNGGVDYVNKWFLMESPVPTMLIVSAYLIFVLKLGPLYMKGRKPYTLKTCLLAYNAGQVILSTVMFVRMYRLMSTAGVLETSCVIEMKAPNDKPKYDLLSLHHLYFLAKITELLDTVFFVLRKKWTQISFLHVYHHTCMTAFAWVGLKYEPAYSYLALGVLNSFVHIIMYMYYGLSSFPKMSKYLWWKKYLTKLQLAQFLTLFVYMIVNNFTTNCPNSKLVLIAYFVNVTLFIYLFSKFYIESYLKKMQMKEKLNTKAYDLKNGTRKPDGQINHYGNEMKIGNNLKLTEKSR